MNLNERVRSPKIDQTAPEVLGPNFQKQSVVLNSDDCDLVLMLMSFEYLPLRVQCSVKVLKSPTLIITVSLDFVIEDNGLKGSALHQEGLAYCWSGARANVGITGGKYRLGYDSVRNLGETEHGFGFGGTGKLSSAGKYSNFGGSIAKQFDAGLKGLGVSPKRELHWQSAMAINLGLPLDDCSTILGPTCCKKDCEMMMMVGLSASGKTTWAEKWVKDHLRTEKCYVMLGTNLILDQMKASRRHHNYIIDQTNVFKSARKRKLRSFADFHKTAVVVLLKPEELKVRSDKRFKEMGKEVPAEAVNNMIV
ncbi:hypothetical protein Patl1_10887 [Pistacia atlantica]|uniref:Uncharacterized protein n=1 Tax=Pistacia atlantica TaxID=434234 RepID=A0ACC1A4Q0_9ROSI|nr:hypothetical protein Patl1_10887 [Pistacia atlantica]